MMTLISEGELQTLTATLEVAVGAQRSALQELLTHLARLRRVCEIVSAPEVMARLEELVAAAESRARELEEAQQLLHPPAPDLPAAANGTAQAQAALNPERAPATIPVSPGNDREPKSVVALREPAMDAGGAAGSPPVAPAVAGALTLARPVAWEPRPVEVLEVLLQQSAEQLLTLRVGSAVDVAKFKAVCALYRGAQLERQRHPGSQRAWNDFGRALRERQRQCCSDHPCVPLGELNLAPAEWQQLAELYYQLGEAQEALDWLEPMTKSQIEAWLARDAGAVLEATAAVLSRLWRWTQTHLAGRREEQLQTLYERLRRLIAGSPLYLRALQSSDVVGDGEIMALAADLQPRLKSLRETTAKRCRKSEALAAFRTFVETPGWGSREGDDEQTCHLAAACLEAGVPATDKPLRDALLECSWMLEDEPDLSRLADAVRLEVERRERRAEPVAPPSGEGIPPELAEMLAEVLPMTNGLRGVFVGGLPRDDTRKAVQGALELSELKWPGTDPADSFERCRAAIRKADLVFLTRFNRRKAKEAYRICNEEDKLLVVLPKGYGLHEVIYRMHVRLGGSAVSQADS